MRWKKRKKKLDEKYEYFWNNIGTDGIGDVVTLQNHISYWTDKSGTVLVELEEEKRMATLKDLLVETYDIFIDGDKYFCVPKFGVIDQDYEYEMRDAAELDCEIGQVNGFRIGGEFSNFASTDTIMSLTTAWTPPSIEGPELTKGRIMEWVDPHPADHYDELGAMIDRETKKIEDSSNSSEGT